MTILSSPSPTASWRSWEVIGGGNNRLIVQRRTVEGLKKNKRISHRLYYGSIDVFPFRIIHSEAGVDFERTFNQGVPTYDADSSADDEHNGSVASGSRRSVSLRASGHYAPVGGKPLPPAGTTPAHGLSLRKRFVVAVAESRDEILADWESIKDGWSLTGGAVNLRQWDQFYQGILRLEQQEQQELEDAARRAGVARRGSEEDEGDAHNQQLQEPTDGARGPTRDSSAAVGGLNVTGGHIDRKSSGLLRRVPSSRNPTPLSRTPQATPQSPTTLDAFDIDSPQEYTARRESLQMASSFDSFAANFIDASSAIDEVWKEHEGTVPPSNVDDPRRDEKGVAALFGASVIAPKHQARMRRVDVSVPAAADAELWGARVVAAWTWCDAFHSILVLSIVSHGLYVGWLYNSLAVLAVVALSGCALPAGILGLWSGFKIAKAQPVNTAPVDVGFLDSIDGQSHYKTSVGEYGFGAKARRSVRGPEGEVLLSSLESSYVATAAATLHSSRASLRLEQASVRENALRMQQRWGAEGASNTLFDSDSDNDVLDDWEASLIASGLTPEQISANLGVWFFFIGGRPVAGEAQDAFAQKHAALVPTATRPGLLCDLTSSSATRTFFASLVVVCFASRVASYQAARLYQRLVCGGRNCIPPVGEGSCFTTAVWIEGLSITGLLDQYGGWGLLLLLLGALAFRGLASLAVLAPLFDRDGTGSPGPQSPVAATSPTFGSPLSGSFSASRGGLIFDGKTVVGESPDDDEDDAISGKSAMGGETTMRLLGRSRKEEYDLRTAIVTRCMDLLSHRDWRLKWESDGVKFFSRPSDFCGKEAVLFSMVLDGANAGTFDLLVNDDPLCRNGKESTAHRTDGLITEATVIEEFLQCWASKKLGPAGRQYAAVSLVRSAYRSPVFGIAPRDMVTKFLTGYYCTPEEQAVLGVGMCAGGGDVPPHFAATVVEPAPPSTTPLNVFVQCAVDAGNGPSGYKSVPGFTRGAVHQFIILVEDLPPARKGEISTRCRVTMGQSVDPQGRVPAKLVDLTNNEQLEKMKVLRRLALAMGPVLHENVRKNPTIAAAAIGARSHTEDGSLGSSHPNRLNIVDRYVEVAITEEPQEPGSPSVGGVEEKEDGSPPAVDPPVNPLLFHNVRFLQEAGWHYSSERKGVLMFTAPSPFCEKEACKFVARVSGANAASFERVIHDVDLSSDEGLNAPGSNVFKYDSLLQHRTRIVGRPLEHAVKISREAQRMNYSRTFSVGLTPEQAADRDISIMHTKFKTPVWGVAPRDMVIELCQGAYADLREQDLIEFGVRYRDTLSCDRTVSRTAVPKLPNVPTNTPCRLYYRAGLDRGQGLIPPTAGFQRGAAWRYMVAVVDDPLTVRRVVIEGAEVEVATECVIVQIMNVDPRGSVPSMAVSLTNTAQMDALATISKLMREVGPAIPRRPA